MKVEIKRNGKRWDIVVDGEVVEGGFFSKAAAENYANLEYGPQD